MEFNLTINLDNAAFSEGNNELSRILKSIADNFLFTCCHEDKINVRDTNGNTVGYYEITL